MGLLEFFHQWRGSRATVGISASLLIHVLVVAAVLWGAKLPIPERWRAKPGDSLIVELPKLEEPASAGSPDAPAGPVTPEAPPSPAKSPPPAPPAPPARRESPAPRQVASVQRAPEPSRAAPRAAEPPRVVPRPAEPPSDTAAAKAPSPAETSSSESTTPKVEREPPGPRAEPGSPQVAGLPPGGRPAPAVPDIRSALRRGGGGRGEGRGGILGDPITLDTQDARFSDFMGQVKRQIEAKLTYPCIKNPGTFGCEPKDTEVIVEFGVLRNGRLQFVDLWVASQWPDYDSSSVTAIRLAQPFPPVPPAIMATRPPGSTGLPITGRFTFHVTYSTLVR